MGRIWLRSCQCDKDKDGEGEKTSLQQTLSTLLLTKEARNLHLNDPFIGEIWCWILPQSDC